MTEVSEKISLKNKDEKIDVSEFMRNIENDFNIDYNIIESEVGDCIL